MNNSVAIATKMTAPKRRDEGSDHTAEIGADLRRAYLDESARLLRRRLSLTMALLLLFLGAAVLGECLSFPDRAPAITFIYGLTVVASLTALVACRIPALQARTTAIAAGAMAIVAVLMSAYGIAVGTPVERAAMTHLCLTAGLVVMLSWGWRAQLVVAMASLIGFGIAVPYLVAQETILYSVITVLVGVTTSVCGAYFFEHYRWDAFVRAELLKREAEIAAALVHVGEELSAHLNESDLLSRVNTLAAKVLECDWSGIFRWYPAEGIFRLDGSVGGDPELVTEIAGIDFPADALPLLEKLKPGTLIEIPDARTTTEVPPDVLQRWQISSALYVPISRGSEMVGFLSHGYRERTGPFSDKQRRVSIGIAHATALALHNASLIADLQAASALKSEFVSTMSHELRTPLNVISGYADLLTEGAFEPLTEDQEDTVGRIKRSALELLDLVTATLDLGRLDAGKERIVWSRVDLAGLAVELGKELDPLVRDDVALRWRIEAAETVVRSDRVKLKTVLKNLVGNALKFTTRGSVDVVVEGTPEELRIEVRDTGIGIATEDLPVIFDMFRQGDGSDSRRFGGVGLGLHIVRRLTDLLNGEVSVSSVPDVGSTFTVRLPLQPLTPSARDDKWRGRAPASAITATAA